MDVNMKKTSQFIKDTLVGGVLFLLPGALLLWLAEKVLPLARQLMKPVESLFPGHLVAQFALGTVLAVLALLLVAFIAGMLARTAPGQRLIRWLEESIVGSLPQYRMAQPVLVPAGEGWRIGMKFDSIEGGWASVFLPNSPKAQTGSIVLLPESSLRPLGLPIAETTLLLSRLGGGAGAALRGVKLD
jgi:uncharacterized membrane protein